MRSAVFFVATMVAIGSINHSVSAEEQPDPHREFLLKTLHSRAAKAANCLACHAQPRRLEADPAGPKIDQADKLERGRATIRQFTADIKVERVAGDTVAAPQVVLQTGNAATVSLNDRKVEYTLRVNGARAEDDPQHVVELSAVAVAADGAKTDLTKMHLLTPAGQECTAEVNGLKFTIKVRALK